MRRKLSWVLVLSAALLALVPSGTQAQEKRVNVSLGGGFTVPNSEVSDRLGNGYNFTFGIDIPVTPVVSIEGQYGFNGLGSKKISLPVSVNPLNGSGVPTDFTGDMNMQYGTGSLIVQAPSGTVRPFGLVGMGVYYRPMKITTPGVGYLPGYCDPWWYVCYPGGWVPVENVVGERSSTDFGMVFGGGLRFGPIFGEIRYHYIWGPTIEGQNSPVINPLTTPPGSASLAGRKANGQFLATTFGVRF